MDLLTKMLRTVSEYPLPELDLDIHEVEDILQALITVQVEHTEDHLRRILPTETEL